jgi:hypothetical protein
LRSLRVGKNESTSIIPASLINRHAAVLRE